MRKSFSLKEYNSSTINNKVKCINIMENLTICQENFSKPTLYVKYVFKLQNIKKMYEKKTSGKGKLARYTVMHLCNIRRQTHGIINPIHFEFSTLVKCKMLNGNRQLRLYRF